MLETWYSEPVFQRDQKTGLLNLSDVDKLFAPGRDKVKAGATQFHELLKANLGLFKASEQSPDWQEYAEYVDETVLDGLHNTVHRSLSYVLDHMDLEAKQNPDGSAVRPLFEGKLALVAPDLQFDPGMSENDPGAAFKDQLLNLGKTFFNLGAFLPRLATHLGHENYEAELLALPELSELLEELELKTESVINRSLDYEQELRNKYAYLWLDDRAAFLQEFLKYGRVLTPQDHEEHPDGVPESPATLPQFKEQIDKFNEVGQGVLKMKDHHIFDQWFRLDVRAFKSSLHNTVGKWSFLFIKHLQDHLVSSLEDLDRFIKKTDAGLSKPVKEGDYDALVSVMSYLNAVASRTPATGWIIHQDRRENGGRGSTLPPGERFAFAIFFP